MAVDPGFMGGINNAQQGLQSRPAAPIASPQRAALQRLAAMVQPKPQQFVHGGTPGGFGGGEGQYPPLPNAPLQNQGPRPIPFPQGGAVAPSPIDFTGGPRPDPFQQQPPFVPPPEPFPPGGAISQIPELNPPQLLPAQPLPLEEVARRRLAALYGQA